ncbi:MAG TPA: hypothetical protein VKZ79_13100 [Alphaproteobacteria bacterium]|nr:hypothetical protein [Alphaproteobacteria bacterium]
MAPDLDFGRVGPIAAALAVVALSIPAASAGETRGFAVSWFQPAYHVGDDDCPKGVSQELDWTAIFTKEGKTPEQIKALFEHPLSPEFRQAALHRGPHGEDVCAYPESVPPDTSWPTVQGKVAYGANLDGTADGSATKLSCKHQKFVGADGTPAVDNQMYRVMGCSKIHRGSAAKDGRDAFGIEYINERMREGMVTYLIEITGITDPKNSDNVEVSFYQGLDGLMQDGAGGVQADQTLRIDADTRWQGHTHGRIKDGVLTTEPFDFNVKNDPVWMPEMHFKRARLELAFQPDGSLKGHLNGYQDWDTVFWGLRKTGFLLEKFSAGNCPAMYYAFKTLADGDPDPKTGECTTISTSYAVDAVPAFLVHPQEEKGNKTAAADGTAEKTAAR